MQNAREHRNWLSVAKGEPPHGNDSSSSGYCLVASARSDSDLRMVPLRSRAPTPSWHWHLFSRKFMIFDQNCSLDHDHFSRHRPGRSRVAAQRERLNPRAQTQKAAAPPVSKERGESDKGRADEASRMQVGRVTLVLAETVFGEARAEFAHQRIARHLRDDTCGGNAEAEAISGR